MKGIHAFLLVVLFLSCGGLGAQEPGILIEEDGQPDIRLKNFHRDLGHNFRNLFSLQNTGLFTGSVFATQFALQLDDRFENYFEAKDRWGKADDIGHVLGGGYVVGGAAGGFLLASQFIEDQKFRRMSYSLAQAYVINSAVTMGFKQVVGRTRPDGSNHLSFVSGHTSSTVAMATVFQHYYGWKAGIPAYALASFVALSRMERNVHFFSDVVAGAALGYLVGRTVTRKDNPTSSSILFAPFVGPDGGTGLGLTIRF